MQAVHTKPVATPSVGTMDKPSELGIVMACVQSIAEGHSDTHHQTQECFCTECGVSLDTGEDHKSSCLTVRAKAFLDSLSTEAATSSTLSADLLATVTPRPLQYPLDAYWKAASGEGPLAKAYDNKPNEIVYDLVAALLAQQLKGAQGEKP